MKNKKNLLSLTESLFPVFILILLLAYNVYIYGDLAMNGSNQFILLLGAAIAVLLGLKKGVLFKSMINDVSSNLKSITGAILILLFVGALSGTWLISGIIPSMIYYGLQVLHPSVFLPSCLIICAVISVSTGSSWTTSATVGIALIGIGRAIEIPVGMVAGAVISGAYFGDKLSPLSDTTNLAPAVSGSDLFTHIKYLTITTVPTIIITLIVLSIINFFLTSTGPTDHQSLLDTINNTFYISPFLFMVPLIVIFMIFKKTPPLIALFIGTVLGGIFAVIFQSSIINHISGNLELTFSSAYQAVLNAITIETSIDSGDPLLNDLFKSGGMKGMLNTIWLVICAMVFGGVMESIGALKKISSSLLELGKSTFSTFASTVGSCLAINLTASDQYLSIVIPGKMFSKAYEDKGLAPENLSRTLEDSGTVTSALIPWNTCGAYQSGILGVSVADYFIYAIFNWLSPFMTLLIAAFNIKIKKLKNKV
ncbi:MAG: Na+/H+ antiporter NhaC [Flavobacteriaceae bacterium]|nr:Na+/H+ antiporter NhaC [Flavobacteriaceae bacterium]MBT7624136.1 Na+/H+ antiporter NhaC [Flavobacteriaceae bacterium]